MQLPQNSAPLDSKVFTSSNTSNVKLKWRHIYIVHDDTLDYRE